MFGYVVIGVVVFGVWCEFRCECCLPVGFAGLVICCLVLRLVLVFGIVPAWFVLGLWWFGWVVFGCFVWVLGFGDVLSAAGF